MTESKSVALPLGYIPINENSSKLFISSLADDLIIIPQSIIKSNTFFSLSTFCTKLFYTDVNFVQITSHYDFQEP